MGWGDWSKSSDKTFCSNSGNNKMCQPTLHFGRGLQLSSAKQGWQDRSVGSDILCKTRLLTLNSYYWTSHHLQSWGFIYIPVSTGGLDWCTGGKVEGRKELPSSFCRKGIWSPRTQRYKWPNSDVQDHQQFSGIEAWSQSIFAQKERNAIVWDKLLFVKKEKCEIAL